MDYTEVCPHLGQVMDQMINSFQAIIITPRGKKKGVLLSEKDYDDFLKDLYLPKEKTNYGR